MNYNRNKKFFRKTSSFAIKIILGLIVVGLILLSTDAMPLGILLIVGAVALGWALFTGKPTAEEIDGQASSFIKGIEDEVLNKLMLEKEQLASETIYFWCYDLGRAKFTDPECDGMFDQQDSKTKLWRSCHVAVTVFCFTADAIHYYRKYVSLVSNASKVDTDELFYKHVTGVSSTSGEYEVDGENGGKEKRSGNQLMLRSGGDKFPFYAWTVDDTERAARAIKTMLREKMSA